MKTIIHILCLAFFITLMLTPEVQAQRRKGWSPQAKGAAIGTGAGAAAGAIINKRNRVVGGVIGGLAGGAAGYAIGKHKFTLSRVIRLKKCFNANFYTLSY